MKYLSYILMVLALCLIMGCGEKEREGTDPGKDTEAVVVRNEDAVYEALGENPLSPEYKAKEKAKMDAAMKKFVVKDEKVGEGDAVKDGDTVKVHYTGRLDDGKVFDTSLKNEKEPFSVKVGAGMVIKGWDLGLVGMKVGGKRLLTIPPELGYGDHPAGPIPANSTLHFEVELISIDNESASQE